MPTTRSAASASGLADPDRLASLARTELAGSPPEPAFDRVTRLVTRALDVPVSMLSFLDADRHLVKSATGLLAARRELPLRQSLCRHVVLRRAPFVLEDVRADPRQAGAASLGVGAYAGVPLHGPGGSVVGALCAVDHEPRAWSAAELAVLVDLASGVDDVVALRTAAAEQRTAVLDLSHVLRSGLTGLRLEAEDLAAGGPDELRASAGAVAAGVVEAADAAARALALVERASAATTTTADVGRLVAEVAVRARTALGRDVVVDASGPAPVDAPPGALAQVLDDVVAALGRSGPGPVRLSVLPGPAVVRVRVRDDGTLPPEVSRGLAERRDAAGAGDAVSVAERAARDLGGRLVVTSTRPATVDVVLRRA